MVFQFFLQVYLRCTSRLELLRLFPLESIPGGKHASARSVARHAAICLEFVLPPFVEYTFEADLEVCSCMPASQQEDRFGELSRRWKLQRPLTEEVPELRQLLGCCTVLLRNPHLEATWGRKETQDANGSNAEPPCARRKWTFGARTARLDRPAVFLLRDFAWMLPEYAGHTPSQVFQVLHRQKSLPAPPHTPLLCFR